MRFFVAVIMCASCWLTGSLSATGLEKPKLTSAELFAKLPDMRNVVISPIASTIEV